MLKSFTIFKKLLLTNLLLFLSIFSTSSLAITKFDTTYQVYYRVEQTGNTKVTFAISQKNNLSAVYATEYGISLNETKINNLKVLDEGVPVTPNVVKNQNQTIISFPFAKKVAGKDKVHNFSIEYDTPDIVSKQGNTWQINIPRFEADENVTNQTAILSLPENFPEPAYIDPKPDIVNKNTYYFSSKIMANKPISAIFGKNQYFKGKINYYLKNETSLNAEKTIALPPNTSYQSVYYQQIDPKPDSVKTDIDGNLLATYKLKPSQELEISAVLFVKTDFLPKENPSSLNAKYLENNTLWNYENIAFTTPELKNLTSPKSIYDYTAGKLKYDYQKINRNGTKRVPASESFKNHLSAICTDYTDLFVSLARKAGIPSRELEGFAISQNLDLNPLASDIDILHAWPEYFDQEKQAWIQVDPTWGNTTRGLDYFNKLDFNHIVFVIHGTDPELPLPAGAYKNPNSTNKQLEFEAIEEISFPQADLTVYETEKSFFNTKLVIKNNSGVYFSGLAKITDSTNFVPQETKLYIPPFSESKIQLKTNLQNLFSSESDKAIINIDGKDYQIAVEQSSVPAPTLLAGASLILGATTLIAWGLLFRKRK